MSFAQRAPRFAILATFGAASMPVWAQSASAPVTSPSEPTQTVVIKPSANASAKGLTDPYAGGQVARGGRIGMLGDQDMMDTPFAITSYTNELIQDQQSKSVGDVLLNDPSVRVARGFGNFQESYFIRGFVLSSDNVAYNGLYDLLPRQYIAAELFERVEVFKGASASLNGASPGGDAIGGSVNLLPKRAPNTSLTQVTIGEASGAQSDISVDIARRFGADKSTGLRLAAGRRNGGTGIDDENIGTSVFSLGLDWHSRDLRVSTDIGHQDNRLKRTRTNVTLGALVTAVPNAPDAASNWAQDWSYSNERDTFGTLRAEYDLNSAWTAWIAAGERRSNEANSLANLTLTNNAGDGTTYRFDNAREDNVATGEVGLRGKLKAGSVTHSVVISGAAFRLDKKNAYATSPTAPASLLYTNLYHPVDSPAPTLTTHGNDLADPKTTGRTKLRSVALADTLGFVDDTALLTVGLRRQTFDVRTFAYNTGIAAIPYEKTRISPVIGGVFKASSQFSVYANYIESLAQGETAPTTAANFGAQLAPYVSRQKEVGLKFDGGRFGGSAAFFTTSKPRAFLDADNIFSTAGEDRHQGLELSVFGLPATGLRVIGGVTFLDAKQRETGVTSTEGEKVIGVPDVQGSLDVDWDVPGVSGFGLNTRVVLTDRVYANATNTLVVPSWTRLDVGARYTLDVAGREVTFRARVDNVIGTNYWASSGGYPNSGYLVAGAPRTFTLSGTVGF